MKLIVAQRQIMTSFTYKPSLSLLLFQTSIKSIFSIETTSIPINILFSVHKRKSSVQIINQNINMHMDLIHAGAAVGSSLTWTLSSDYGYVLLTGVLIAFEILLIGFLFPGKVRGQVFTEQFMKTNFGEDHKRATGNDIEKGGYPDMGNGKYSGKLTYEQWYKFNNAQRAHYNFLEFAPSCLIMHFIAGIYFPVPAAALGLAVIIGRIVYSVGYVNSGPKGRVIGALIGDLVLLGQLGLSIASSIMFIQGKEAL